MLRGFMVFENTGSDLIKKIAGYHQFHAVHKAVQCTIKATDDSGDNELVLFGIHKDLAKAC